MNKQIISALIILAVLATPVSSWSWWIFGDDKVKDDVLHQPGEHDVVVIFKGDITSTTATLVEALAASGTFELSRLESSGRSVAKLTTSNIGQLDSLMAVERIVPNYQFDYQLHTKGLLNSGSPPPLDYKNEQTHAAETRSTLDLSGKGTVVAVVDNGVYADHSYLQRKGSSLVIASKDFSKDADSNSTRGQPGDHGTHVAGIIAGQQMSVEYRGATHDIVGIAPGIEGILNAKALSAVNGEGDLWSLMNAVDWSVDKYLTLKEGDPDKYQHLIISMSLGRFAGSADSPDVEQIVETWQDHQDIFFVIAIGNEGVSDSPGKAPVGLAVGATTHEGEVDYYSGKGPAWDSEEPLKPNLVAPGTDVFSSTYTKGVSGSNGSYCDFMTGTSMATPVVTGSVALLLEQNPGLSNQQIKEIIQQTARSTGNAPDEVDPIDGYGIIDVLSAATDANPEYTWPEKTTRAWYFGYGKIFG